MGHYTDFELVYTEASHQSVFADWSQDRRDEEGRYASIPTHAELIEPGKTYPASIARDRIEKYAASHMDSYHRNGACLAVYRDQDIARRVVTVRATIPGEAWGEDYDQREKAINELAASKAGLKNGEFIEGWTYGKRSEQRTGWNGQPRTVEVADVTIHSKVVATAPKEKAETRYFVHARTGLNIRTDSDQDWANGFPTQAAARAAMVEALERSNSSHPEMLQVTALTRRTSGAALVTAERRITKVQVVVEVTAAKVKPNAKAGGWVMAMRYHR